MANFPDRDSKRVGNYVEDKPHTNIATSANYGNISGDTFRTEAAQKEWDEQQKTKEAEARANGPEAYKAFLDEQKSPVISISL